MKRIGRRTVALSIAVISLFALVLVTVASATFTDDNTPTDPGPTGSSFVWSGTVSFSPPSKYACVNISDGTANTKFPNPIACSVGADATSYSCSLSFTDLTTLYPGLTHWQLVASPNENCGGEGAWVYEGSPALFPPLAATVTDLSAQNSSPFALPMILVAVVAGGALLFAAFYVLKGRSAVI